MAKKKVNMRRKVKRPIQIRRKKAKESNRTLLAKR